VTQALLGFVVQPAKCTRRLPSAIIEQDVQALQPDGLDGQPLSFSASSVWGVSTRFRLQIRMILRCEQSFGTPYLFLHAFDMPATVRNTLLTQATQSVATALPLTPAGIGTEQALLVYIFLGSAASSVVLSFSVGMKVVLIVVNLVVGLAALALMTRTLRLRGALRSAAGDRHPGQVPRLPPHPARRRRTRPSPGPDLPAQAYAALAQTVAEPPPTRLPDAFARGNTLSTARPSKEDSMDAWVWIVIAVVAILVLVLAALTLRRNTGARRLDKKRAEAGELRQEAQQRMGTAGQREAAAKQEVEGARREREAAEETLRRADDVDPDVPDVDR
jgi:hypothetical protein